MHKQTNSQYIKMLGERLERSRLLRNIPQSELARQAGISPRTLRRMESGEGASLESFIRLLSALDLDGNLAALIPDHSVRPMERTRVAKTERMRASRTNKTTDKSTTAQTTPKSKKGATTSGAEST